jgi:hypothetical protein
MQEGNEEITYHKPENYNVVDQTLERRGWCQHKSNFLFSWLIELLRVGISILDDFIALPILDNSNTGVIVS